MSAPDRSSLLRQWVLDYRESFQEGGARYTLIVGPQGSGKSYLLGQCRMQLEALPGLPERAVICALSELEYVSSLLDLLARILSRMPEEDGFSSPIKQARSLVHTPGREGEERAVRLIDDRLGGRSLLLVLESIDHLFEALREPGEARLRSILQSAGRWSILASARTESPAFTDRERPFYKMFVRHTLEPLDKDQVWEFLLYLAREHSQTALERALRLPEGRAAAAVLHGAVGAQPGILSRLFRYLSPESLLRPEVALQELAAEWRPYYRQMLLSRPPAQRPLLSLLASSGRPLTVSEIAAATFNTHQTTSGLLRYLLADRLLTAQRRGRTRLYVVSDPLFRLCFRPFEDAPGHGAREGSGG